jgi:asparagine synthase (glutamine-hydrolysing)
MSVQAGIWNFDGRPVDRALIESYGKRLAKCGPDGENVFLDGPIGMLYRPFHTTRDSRLEQQPHRSLFGNVITWDGRLDNRDELAAQLTDRPGITMTDVDVVATAFDRWGSDCFAKFIGDWAFAGWDPRQRTLTLAIDYMAIKHLYYYLQPDNVAWCTDLEALLLQSGDQFDLDDEYVAGYLASNPSPGRTPYLQIRSVEPGHFVRIHAGQAVSRAHFQFNPKLKIHYKTDAEYEEHFRHVFRQAVRRRLRSDSPILADLSGGLDSSSIVCMADDILAKEGVETPRLDTYSFYDLGEPYGDDLQYFTIVEKKRGRAGDHLNIAACSNSVLPDPRSLAVTPGHLGMTAELELERSRIWRSGGYAVRLCGIGGDEMLGGVPEPRPELADLIVQLRPVQFLRQTMAWSLVKRRPWIRLALQSAALLLPATVMARTVQQGKLAPWLDAGFASRFKLSRRQLGPMGRYGFWLPSRQEVARTVVAMSRRMTRESVHGATIEDIRYPYLDQTLVEFILSVPRIQIIRPGQRRSLMRRALAGLVPDEVLSRRTKATAARRPMLALENDWERLDRLLNVSLADLCGYVDQGQFRNTLIAAKGGDAPHLVRLLQTLSLELWLGDAIRHRLIRQPLREASPSELSPTSPRLRNRIGNETCNNQTLQQEILHTDYLACDVVNSQMKGKTP